jgi:hypothetical protein
MDDAQRSNVSHLAGTAKVITPESVAPAELLKLACSFCRRPLPEVGYMVGSTVACICKSCLEHLSAVAAAQKGSE